MDSKLDASLQQKYPTIQWELANADPRVISEILPVFERTVQEWPILLSQLHYIGTDWSGHRDDIAITHYVNPDTTNKDCTEIYLNPKFYGNYAVFNKDVQGAETAGFHVQNSDSVGASFIHELATL